MISKAAEIRTLVREINRSFLSLIKVEVAKFGLTPSQMMVIHCLKDGPKKISMISNQIELSNSTVSGIIDRLEQKEFLQRIRDKEDQRIVWVHGTSKMEQMQSHLSVVTEQFYDELIDGLPIEEVDITIHSLKRLADHLDHKATEQTNDG